VHAGAVRRKLEAFLKVFLDTSVLYSALWADTVAHEVIRAAYARRWNLFVSDYVVAEWEKIIVRIHAPVAKKLLNTAQRLALIFDVVTTPESKHIVVADSADSPVLRGAVACGADYLLSFDTHLLKLHPYEGIEIVRAGELLRIIHEQYMV